MKLWDRGRLGEVGIDLRGTWFHRLLCRLFYKEVPYPQHVKWSERTPEYIKQFKRAQRMARLSCFCEPCWREFLPWPFSWGG